MKNEYVYEQFQLEFKIPSVKTYQMVMELVNANKQVRKWYSDLKETSATLTEMPNAYKEAGMTTQQWEDLSLERNILKNANKEYSMAASEAAKIFKTAMAKADKKRIDDLDKVSMLTRLTSLSFNELSIQNQVEVLSIEDKEQRKNMTKVKVDAITTQLVKDLLQGKDIKDPFV